MFSSCQLPTMKCLHVMLLLLLGCCVDVGVAGLNGSNTERLEVRGASFGFSEGVREVCVCEGMKSVRNM